MGHALLSAQSGFTFQGFHPIEIASIAEQLVALLGALKKRDLMGVFRHLFTVVTGVLSQAQSPHWSFE